MKSVNHVFEVSVSKATRETAVHNVIRNARRTREFKRYAKDTSRTVELAEEWLLDYHNDSHHAVEIYDGISHKKRTIIVPTTRELIVQHCIVEALKPMFFRGMYRHSYASIPWRWVNSGNEKPMFYKDVRGSHAGKKVIERWMRDRKNTKYVLKMDIRHYFDSIPHDRLKKMLRGRIHDEKMLKVLFEIIDVVPNGLPLGFYSSQWLSNWYLEGLDHYIKEQLGAVYYIRYMDDMVIFGSNKRKLHEMRKLIQKYLEEKLGLTLKDNWQVFRFEYQKGGRIYGRDLDFMGFRFHRYNTTLRRSIMLKCTRKAKKISKKEHPTVYDARQMMSYNGYLKHTDTHTMYLRYIKPYINFEKLKEVISNYDKRRLRYEICN
jgi:hypothetical protein